MNIYKKREGVGSKKVVKMKRILGGRSQSRGCLLWKAWEVLPRSFVG